MTDEELIGYLRRSSVGYTHPLRLAADRIEALVKENADFQQTFDFQWNADMRAIKMWQEAHPGNDLVWPDGAKLSVWLMERAERLEAAMREIDALDPEVEWIGACSENAIRGLVLRMGEIARAALKGADHEN